MPYSEFKTNVVDYIGGYIVMNVAKKLSCEDCILSLTTDPYAGLIQTRDIGEKLKYPSLFVQKTLQIAEKVLQIDLNPTCLMKPYYFDFVKIKICNSFVSLHSEIFRNMDNHCYELMKKIVSCYCSIRFKSFVKEQNDLLKRNRVRSKLNKLVLFNHQ